MIHIFDCNNWVRVQYETDPSGLALKNLFNEAYYSPDLHIYVFDGFNSRQKRRELYSDYKVKRQKGSDNFYETLKLFKQLVGYTKQFKIEIPEWEADDIINHLVITRPPGTKIKVYSTDRDFAPLACDDVQLTQTAIANASPQDVRLYKTLVRDQSDNIPGISKFGDKSWEALTEQDKLAWVEFLEGRATFYPLTGMSNASLKWMDTNQNLIKTFWKIVDFLPMDASLIDQHMVMGAPNLELANLKFKELFL